VKKRADASCLSANPDDCLVWCLVETPAEYQTVTKRVNKGCDGSGVADGGCAKTIAIPAKMGTRTVRKVKTPATTREEVIPAEYKTVTVRKVKTPATTREEVIPAEYKAVSTRGVKVAATTRTENIPAEYATVTKRRLVKAGGFTEWREVLCDTKVTGYTIRQIQDALNKQGYDAGAADNVMGARTKAALTKYQKDKGLPVGNLDFETLKSLGVNY
jgi:Putative peptidoglycan binding domain